MYLTNSPDTLHKNFVLQMAHESAIVPSSNVKDGDESENEIDLEEGEIEDEELTEEGETRTFDHETTVPLKIEHKLQQAASPIAKLEPRAPLLPLPTRHPNPTIKRRPPPQRNYNSRHLIKEEEPDDDDWASTLERALAQKAALASENANAKIKHVTSGINEEDSRNSHDEEDVDDEDDDKKLRRKKRKKKLKDDEENDGEPKDSKRRRKSHHKRTEVSWECKDEDEEEDGDEDEMLFVRGASPTVRNIYHDDEDDSPRNFRDDSFSYSDQGEVYDESYGNYGEHKNDDDDDDDFDIRGSYSRRGPRDGEDEDRHLNRGLKRRPKGSGIVRGGSDRMQLTKRLSGRREGLVKPRGGKRSNSRGPQERDSVCLFFMQGKCHRGNDCPYSHDAMPPKKMELCKFYLMDCCAKKDKCLYMHQNFPCKFYHTGMKCYSGSRCKFSHGKLTDQMKSILLKHLETSPKDCVGDFPRVNREGSTGMNYNKKSASRPNKPTSKKIPSLFDIEVPVYVQRMAEKKDVDTDEQSPPRRTTPMPESDVEDQDGQQTPVLSSPKTERRSSSRTKSSRWSKEDSPSCNNSRDGNSERTPDRKGKYNRDEIEDLDEKPVLRFYQETLSSDEIDHKESSEITYGELKSKRDLNLHRLAGYSPKSSSDAEEGHKPRENSVGSSKPNDNFDSKTMVVTGLDSKRDKLDQAESASETRESQPETGGESGTESNDGANIPLHLPKKQRELFLRIQQQQREAENSKDATGENEDDEDNCRDENWYSSDDEDVPLTDVLKNLTQQEQQQKHAQVHLEDKQQEQSELPSIKDTIASCVAGVGFPDLSQIKISESVTKILSSIRHQAITPITVSPSASISSATLDITEVAQTEKLPSQLQSPTPVARDPRLSRDPRNRSTSAVSSCQGLASPTSTSEVSTPIVRRQDPRSNRMDPRKSNTSPGEETRASVGPSRRGSFTSIYSNAITTTPGDTDLRNLVPHHEIRTADVDLRQKRDTDFRINYAAKDTDLRPKLIDDILSEADNSSHIGDVDLRRMLELPFKPVPMHTPATEIDASLTSHPPIPYKVVEVTIPRPDYTNLKLNTSDPQVENDPRLRKIFKLPTTTATTTIASAVKPTTSTLPSATSVTPRTDPRRLSARGRTHATTIPSSVSTPIPAPITPTPSAISPETLPFPHQPEIPLHAGPLLPTPNMLPNMDPRVLRGNTRNNNPGLLGAAPAGFCPPTPRFEEESDDSAMYQNSWNMHQAQRNNWRGGLRSQQARYMEQDFGNTQGLKSFTPPL